MDIEEGASGTTGIDWGSRDRGEEGTVPHRGTCDR